MDRQISVGGVYDLDSAKTLINCEVERMCFDLRPKSFNFIQGHVLLNILEFIPLGSMTISLLFENEASFIVEKILKDAKQVMAGRGKLEVNFASCNTSDYYEQFNFNYKLVLRELEIPKTVLTSENFRGVVIPYSLYFESTRNQVSYIKLLKLIASIKNHDPSRNIELECGFNDGEFLDPSSDILIDAHYLTIGPDLESHYRQNDPEKVKLQIEKIMIV